MLKFKKARDKNKSYLSGFSLSKSFSAYQETKELDNYSLLTDIGDIILNYGSLGGFRSALSRECLENNY